MVISGESVRYSIRNLKKRKARSFLTILSIFVGITTIFIFISFGWGLYDYIEELTSEGAADKIIVQAKGMSAPGLDESFQLTDDDLEAVKSSSGVYEATGIYFKVAEVKQDETLKYTFLLAYDPQKPLIMEFYDIGVEKGRMLRKGDEGKVVLGYNYLLKDKIFPKALDINDKIEIQGEELRVVGFLESVGSPPDDAQVYIANDYMDELYSGNNSYGWIIARVDKENIDLAIENIEKNLRNIRDLEKGKEDFFVQSFEDMIESYSSALNIVIGFVVLIALISVLVSAINTSNTMITSVLERIKEIGIIKSVGARNREVFKIFLFESGFLGFIAGIIGVIFGWLLTYIGYNILDSLGWGFLQPHYSLYLFLGCILFATITGAISGVIPAINASKINPVDALRYE
jgi:putative ABC transport system permease protein